MGGGSGGVCVRASVHGSRTIAGLNSLFHPRLSDEVVWRVGVEEMLWPWSQD